MTRTDDEVINELKAIYSESFGGKERQRFLLSWADLRGLYGFDRLFETRFARLAERASERGLYLFDLGEGANGHMVAILRRSTVDRWRRAPRKIVAEHLPPPSGSEEPEDEADD